MQIDIQALNIPLKAGVQGHIKRRLGFALGSYDDHILRVMVRLSDINGPRGGEDKRCKIQVVLPQQADVVIENTEAELSTAIDRAADRVARTVSRRLARQREKGRYSTAHRLLLDDLAAFN